MNKNVSVWQAHITKLLKTLALVVLSGNLTASYGKKKTNFWLNMVRMNVVYKWKLLHKSVSIHSAYNCLNRRALVLIMINKIFQKWNFKIRFGPDRMKSFVCLSNNSNNTLKILCLFFIFVCISITIAIKHSNSISVLNLETYCRSCLNFYQSKNVCVLLHK